MFTRRDFIKTMSLLSGAILTPVRWLGKWVEGQPEQAEELKEIGELFAGFVLLPEAVTLPAFVQYPRFAPPNECGLGAGNGGHKANAVVRSYESESKLAESVNFPVYTIKPTSIELRPTTISTISHPNGIIYGTSIGFGILNKDVGIWETIIALWAQPDFYRPYPLWFSNPLAANEPAVTLLKTDGLPSPGIYAPVQMGYIYHWIANDIYYSLTIEPTPSEQFTEEVISSLTIVS